MTGEAGDGARPRPRGQDPLEPAVRPLELCDLCEVARVDYAPGSDGVPPRADIQVPVPPFGDDSIGQGQKPGQKAVPGDIPLCRRRLRCTCHHYVDGRELEELSDRVVGEFCADARSHAGVLLVDALLELAGSCGLPRQACAGTSWARGDLAMAARAALSGRPELQLPADFACVLPAHRLAGLLASPEGHTVSRRPDGKACVSVAGIDAVPYSPALLGPHAAHRCQQLAACGADPQDPFPAFVVPRRESLGLAISDIFARKERHGGRLGFGGDYAVGAGVLRPEGIVEVLPAATPGA